MSKEKTAKIVKSVIVVGTLVAFILLLVIIYQTVCIINAQKKLKEYNDLLSKYEILLSDSQRDLEYYQTKVYLEQLARSYGYVYPGE